MTGIPKEWLNIETKEMGGSSSKEDKSQTVVVSGQANINFNHDQAQWWVISAILFIAVTTILALAIRYVRKIMQANKTMKREIALLRASRGN